ncbi:hypothetical protein JCM9140_4467 [Halalkalibacter wakoensis JCM 9140]|uniref:Uncharacterized protein n=1 Tax=Halalkalibacter wakoensis JCM 9140 TaxID=1236970 RepID=W4Q997_9BACI|nr:hypothetical protein [Halalkalibacter wakoensis]GAE28253.1 hypothetical protein JCM9140_4467 [Halalkalibacter wakoensis JCM 9140]
MQYELFSLDEIEPFFRIYQSQDTAKQKLTMYKVNNRTLDLIVYKSKTGELFLAEGYDYYFSLYNSNRKIDVLCRVGEYKSELEVRYAALRELLLSNSRWALKMNQFSILINQYNQKQRQIADKLGIPVEKVTKYLLDEDIPTKIRILACKYDLGRIANKIARSTLLPRYKEIMYEFVTYPKEHSLRINDGIFNRARLLLRQDSNVDKLSNDDIRNLIIRHAVEQKKRAIENFQYDLDMMLKNAKATG